MLVQFIFDFCTPIEMNQTKPIAMKYGITLAAALFTSFGVAAQNTVNVTFQVDMNETPANPAGVFVAGSFQGWLAGGTIMSDPDGDGIFSVTAPVEVGSLVQWKYMNGPTWGLEETVPPACGNPNDNFNRFIASAPEVDTVLDPVCFGACVACGTQIATTPLTLEVDMSLQTVSASGVHVAGSFQGWNPGGTELTDPDGDGIYSVTLDVEPATYQFKFLNGNAWGSDEAVPSECAVSNNREVTVGTEPLTFTTCYAQCSETCALPTPGADITFQLDASQVEEAAASGVYLVGSFTSPAWQAGAVALADDDGDGVWTTTVFVEGLDEIQFKYSIGDPYPGGVISEAGSEVANFALLGCGVDNGVGGWNRTHVRSGEAEALAVVCFNSCAGCADAVFGCTDEGAVNYNSAATDDDGSCYFNPGCDDAAAQNYDAAADANDGSCQYLVTLRVNMANETVSSMGVHVAGSFQGWDPAATPLALLGYGVYEIQLVVANGTYEYKFVNGNTWGSDESVSGCGNGGNRVLVVDGANVNTEAFCFFSCEACSGCTDPYSAEFHPFAGSDDGSCATPIVSGCTYVAASNYNPAANAEDGSCQFDSVNPCPADLDGNGSIGTPDLLAFLAAFGVEC